MDIFADIISFFFGLPDPDPDPNPFLFFWIQEVKRSDHIYIF